MTPGPKPKGTPKRQTLGVAVQPWTIVEIDNLLTQFQIMQDYLPDWFKVPDTRSSVAAWILERCAKQEMEKLVLVIRTCLELRKVDNKQLDGTATKEEVKKSFDLMHRMSESIKTDVFLNSLYEAFSSSMHKQAMIVRNENTK